MTAIVLLIACMVLGQARSGVVELNCSDNATCIDYMAKEFVRSMRQNQPVRVFEVLTIEPVETQGTRQARSRQSWLSRFFESHAFSFDWRDWSFRLTKPEDRSGVVDLEVYESRTAKDVSEVIPKKSKSKVEEEDDKTPKRSRLRRRRQKKKVLQAAIPLMFGMKSAGAVIFSMAIVTALTLKAFVASKLALAVTVGMALKRLYETYGQGVGLQNHPYLYSQYPIDFPSASSHQYSVSGMNPQFGSPEMYNPALAPHQHELLQQNDASAAQSQQSTLLVNSTRASERWDGKSKLLQFIEPIVGGFKSFIDPIASVFYDAMPATFRGLSSDVSTQKTVEAVKEEVKKPREILVPQPRHIAQRKTNYRKSLRQRPKKYNELKLDLDKLKHTKDFHDYVKTKKYKYNYPNTYYYPRVKYFVNPQSLNLKINTTRLIPYSKESLQSNLVRRNVTPIFNESTEWKPIVVANLDTQSTSNDINPISDTTQLEPLKRKRTRVKRDLLQIKENAFRNSSIDVVEGRHYGTGRGFFDFLNELFNSDPISAIMKEADKYTSSVIQESLKSKGPPTYYNMAYDAVMFSLEVIDGLVNVQNAVSKHINNKNKKKRKYKKNHKNTHDTSNDQSKVRIHKTCAKTP